MSALEPLAPIQPVNFPSDREYTHNALIEELVLIERHLRDESWRLCNCNPEKHLPAIAALGSEGQGFAESDDEREFMRQLQVRARIWRDKIKQGDFTDKDADQLRALMREFRHRIEFQTWTGPMEETPELIEVVTQIHALTGDIPSLEDEQVDQILTKLSEKHGVPKPRYRFVDNCNPLKEAWMVGADLIERDKEGNISRIPLTDFDELVFCRGGASPYAISHEFCHYKDRVKKGNTSESSATKCALEETGNKVEIRKNLNRLSLKKNSGGINMVFENVTERVGGALPLIGGVVVGEAIDASGLIDSTIAPFTGNFTGLAKGVIGAFIVGTGLSMKKGLTADMLVGAGLPIAASGFVQQFLPGGVALGQPTPVMPTPATIPPQITPVQLTSYARPTGLRFGHPTLSVPMIPPRPGILSPSAIPQDLAGKFILGTR